MWTGYVARRKQARTSTLEEIMNRGLISTIVGILVVIILILVIMRLA